MNKALNMPFFVEPNVPSSFSKLTRRVPAVVHTISTSERKRRENAVSAARASVGLEGFKISVEDEARASRFINGEIDLAEFLTISNGH